jgi:hypothetical protein
MGKWIRRGYYPVWLLRLFRYGQGWCEARQVNEHIVVNGETGQLKHDFMHEDRRGIEAWTRKHIQYARREADELGRRRPADDSVQARLFGTQPERVRWLRQNVYNRVPALLRPVLFFLYRYVLSGGFLDGRAAFIYHGLQAFWYPLLTDAFVLETSQQLQEASRSGAPRNSVCAESQD